MMTVVIFALGFNKTVINVSAAEVKVDYKGTSPEAGNLDSRLL